MSPTRYHRSLDLPDQLASTPLSTAFSYTTSHPTLPFLLLWGFIMPISAWLVFPMGFLIGTIGAQVESSTLDNVDPARSPKEKRATARDTATTAQHAAKLSLALVVASLPHIVVSILTAVAFSLYLQSTGELGGALWLPIAGWASFLTSTLVLFLPAGVVRTVRTGSIRAVTSPTTVAAATSTSYLKALFVAGAVLTCYLLVAPFSILIPFIGLLAWASGLAVMVAALSVYIASRTPGKPSEFAAMDQHITPALDPQATARPSE
jgi:hypothetical protein